MLSALIEVCEIEGGVHIVKGDVHVVKGGVHVFRPNNNCKRFFHHRIII